jgi:hypothetical protein
MLNKKERMEKLQNAGVNTNKYFTLNVDESIPAGAKIHIVVDKDGNYIPEVVKEDNTMKLTEGLRKFLDETYDEIFNQIIEDGYVRNTKLHRRFVMAQMFHMLNYVSYDGKYRGYNDCLKRMYGYEYTLNMMTEEVRVLSKLEERDKESFVERSHFFTKEVVMNVLEDYLEKFKAYVEALPDKNCKGIPYKRIKGKNIFNADLDKKLYAPVRNYVFRIRYAKNYNEIYRALESFMRNHVKLSYDTAKSKDWIDAYKGEGAFYTLKNLVMFHNCGIYTGKYGVLDYNENTKFRGIEAINYLNRMLDEYKGEGWRMFALMKKVIADNNFDFDTRMSEIYDK